MILQQIDVTLKGTIMFLHESDLLMNFCLANQEAGGARRSGSSSPSAVTSCLGITWTLAAPFSVRTRRDLIQVTVLASACQLADRWLWQHAARARARHRAGRHLDLPPR